MLDIIIENKKIFFVLLIIILIITIVIIWIPEDDIRVGKYKELKQEEIDKKAIKQYGDEMQLALYTNDVDFLKKKVSSNYLKYIGLDYSEFNNWLKENSIVTASIVLGQTIKYKYGDVNIYSIGARLDGKNQTINIIETSPEKWNYTFDTFYDYRNIAIRKDYASYGVMINSIYQDMNYIKFDVKLYVENDTDNNVVLSKSDSIKLVMEDNSSFIMATNNNTSESIVADGRKYTSLECLFNIPLENQINIDKIVFNVFNVDDVEKNIKIDLDL